MDKGGKKITQMAFQLRRVENRQRGDVSSRLELNLTEVNEDKNQLTELNTNQEVFEGYSRVKEYLMDEREGNSCFNGTLSEKLLIEEVQAARSDDLYSVLDAKSDGSKKAGISSSTTNPNAKEFKFNPNAESFVPSQSSLRPMSHVNIGPYYFPNSMPIAPHMHGMPFGIRVVPPFVVPQPLFFNPPPVFFPANAPQYGRQIIIGPPRQVMYMPGYPADMWRSGHEF